MRVWLQTSSWRSLRLSSGLQERLRRRFTLAGRIVLGGAFSAGLFAVDPRQSLAFQALSLGAALLAVAWLGSLRRPPSLQLQRRLPPYASVGEPCRYRVEVRNNSGRTARGLSLQEALADPRPDLQTFLRTRAPDEQNANPVDRLFAYPRWRWLVAWGRRCDPPLPRPLPALAAGAVFEAELELTPRRRGPLQLQGLCLARADPLGLASRSLTLDEPGRLLVLPQRYAMRLAKVAANRRFQPGGVSLASAVGESQEYIGLRAYRPGDSPRHIHWAAWARTGAPVVKEYQDEYFSRQALILDSFVRAGREDEFEVAVSLAASLVEPLQGADSLLDLMFVADHAYRLSSGRGQMSGQALLEVLACVQPIHDRPFEALSQAVAAHGGALSACVCVLLDWDRPRQRLIEQLLPLGLPLKVLLIGGAQQLDPGPMAGRPGDFICVDPAHPQQGLARL